MSGFLRNLSTIILQPTNVNEVSEELSQQEIISPCSLRSFLTTVLGTLVFVLLVNFVATWYQRHYTYNRGFWLVREKWKMLLNMNKPVDWLILGDSSCNQGVNPEIFEKVLGGRAVNLATIDAVLVANNVWMLETYIQLFGPPENVLIVFGSNIWRRKLNPVLLEKIPLEWGFWNRLRPHLKLRTGDKIKFFLSRYVPLYAENESLNDLITRRSWRPWTLFSQNYHLEEDGYMRWYKPSSAYVEWHTNYLVQIAKENQFEPSEINLRAWEQTIALADHYKINIYIANSPMYEGLYQNESFQAYYGEIREMLKSYTDRNQLVNYIDKSVTFPRDQMENANHALHSAAQIYTKMLVTEILTVRQKDKKQLCDIGNID
ncbi:MAG: hypothetical protein ACFFCW_20060 [Candidatus Hodarchaeota archaeon]